MAKATTQTQKPQTPAAQPAQSKKGAQRAQAGATAAPANGQARSRQAAPTEDTAAAAAAYAKLQEQRRAYTKQRRAMTLVQVTDARANVLLKRLKALHEDVKGWGPGGAEVAKDLSSAIVALQGAREELSEMPADFKPPRRVGTKTTLEEGTKVGFRDKVKGDYGEVANEILTVIAFRGRMVELQTEDKARVFAPRGHLVIQAA